MSEKAIKEIAKHNFEAAEYWQQQAATLQARCDRYKAALESIADLPLGVNFAEDSAEVAVQTARKELGDTK